ncbi:MAG: hypothetical protein JXR31_14280 [Prolixibacteraceae bacterium]|nr:hypothetical protein [Prolixibacteraceae bacterium]MBN2775418.1 hypothetical protein [Prolixibacteraceae bacterium]
MSFTVVSVIEYFAYLPSLARTFIIYAGIVMLSLLVLQFILFPLFQLFRIIKQLSNENLNKIIVKHFPDIKDKLLNILELSRLDDKNYSSEIVLASIDQKIKEIRIFNFQRAIDFKQLRFIFIYLLVSLGIISGIIIFDKPVITESNYRMKNYNQDFSKPAPFVFTLQNENLVVNKGDEYVIQLECEGESLPQLVYINIEGNNFIMKKKDNIHFEYRIESVVNSFQFYFTDLKYVSDYYNLKTLPKPGVSDFEAEMNPPGYTMIGKSSVKNVGDLQIAEGTEVNWKFTCIDTDSLYIQFNNKEKFFSEREGQVFNIKRKIFENSEYRIFIKNAYQPYNEVLSYSISVIPDLFPEIKVVQNRDSSEYSRFYFMGEIADDYGFSRLDFHINANEKDSIFPLDVVRNLVNQEFFYTIDFKSFDFESDEISYYFSVTDNDGINGPKTTTSGSYIFVIPTEDEIEKYDKEQFAEIEDMVEESRQLADEIREGLKELQIKSMDPKISDWEKSQLVNDIVNKKDALEELFEQVKEQNEDLNNFMNSFTEEDDELLKKQEQIEELLEEVFSDELKELMEEFEKLAEEFNENKLNNISKQLDMSMEELSEQMDRNLEMLRKMKLEQNLQKIIERMYQLGTDEEKLSEEVAEDQKYNEILEKDQKNKDELEKIQEELHDALEMNKKLEEPLEFDDFEPEFDYIKESFELNKENLEKKRRSKSSQSIKETSEQINNLAFNMDQLLQSLMMKQKFENIENLRQILSNLIYFSFSEEDVMAQLTGIDLEDPLLNSLKRKQKNLEDQSVVIKDSLRALANRAPEISNMISKELLLIQIHLLKAQDNLEEGLLPASQVSQQFILTSVNNLALMLNEALDILEKQMANSMPGNQSCENPGNNPGNKNMSQMQQSAESIKQQLQKLIEEMKNGNGQNMSRMLGETLMQHEMMQNKLRDLMNNGSVGSSAREMLKNIDKMLEESRQEIINKSVSEKTLIRQNQIMTRLLEAEKAEMERDIDNKRESETADEDFYSNPVKYFEYNRKTENSLENMEQNIFKLNSFYNKKYKKYLNSMNEQGTFQ